MSTPPLSHKEITIKMKELLGVEQDQQLDDFFDLTRGTVNKFSRKKRVEVTTYFITELLRLIEEQHLEKSASRKR